MTIVMLAILVCLAVFWMLSSIYPKVVYNDKQRILNLIYANYPNIAATVDIVYESTYHVTIYNLETSKNIDFVVSSNDSDEMILELVHICMEKLK